MLRVKNYKSQSILALILQQGFTKLLLTHHKSTMKFTVAIAIASTLVAVLAAPTATGNDIAKRDCSISELLGENQVVSGKS